MRQPIGSLYTATIYRVAIAFDVSMGLVPVMSYLIHYYPTNKKIGRSHLFDLIGSTENKLEAGIMDSFIN